MLAPMLAMLLGASPVLADEDVPDPAVARISVLLGDVEIRRADSGDAVAAAVNAPLLAGDYLSTHDGARAEVQFDYGSTLRAGSGTEVRFTQLDSTNNAVQLAQGTVELRVTHLTDSRPEIDTPSGAVRPEENGRYRVSVTDDGDTLVTVRSGRADIVSPQSVRSLAAGSTALLQGSASDPSYQIVESTPLDEFDRWNDERDRYVERVRTSEYVSDGIVGGSDLDQYGRWVYVSGYGNVWAPYAAAGWAPYTAGRWVWEGYYGWTWVSDEPWGWAPYHYGRWFYNPGYGWCWYPEPVQARPVWRPALVAFFSFGGGGVAFGNVGWVPLAPHERYDPWFGRRHLDRGVTIVNNTTTITNITIYKNVNAPGAVNGISHHDFAGGQFNRVVRVTPIEMRGAVPVHGVLPVVPTAANLRPSDRPIVRRAGAVPIEQRFTRFAAPRSTAVPFTVQREEAQAAAQRRYPSHATEILHESQAPALKAMPPGGSVNDNANAQRSPAWRRFEEQQGPPVRRSPAASGEPVHAIDGSAAVHPLHTPEVRTETAPPQVLRAETAPPQVLRAEPIHTRVPRSETEHPQVLHGETEHPQVLRSETPHPRILHTETAQPAHLRGTTEPAPHPTATHGTRRRPNGEHAEERATPR